MNKRISIILQRYEIEEMVLKHLGLKLPDNWTVSNMESFGELSFSWEETYIPHTFSIDAKLPDSVMNTLRTFCENHEWIRAIKECRTVTGWGLRDAKDYVEYQFRELKAKREW